MDKVREIWLCVDSSASVLLLIRDVTHDDGVYGHVEDVHEHGRCHVRDGHYQYRGRDEIRHLHRRDERVAQEDNKTQSVSQKQCEYPVGKAQEGKGLGLRGLGCVPCHRTGPVGSNSQRYRPLCTPKAFR
jgi:hypothetical protein